MLNLNFQKISYDRLLMFLNIKEVSRALSFDSSVTNNDLFGRQAPYFVEKFYLEKITKGEQDTFFGN